MNVAQVGGSIDGGGKLLLTAEEDKVVVVRWAWASVRHEWRVIVMDE